MLGLVVPNFLMLLVLVELLGQYDGSLLPLGIAHDRWLLSGRFHFLRFEMVKVQLVFRIRNLNFQMC